MTPRDFKTSMRDALIDHIDEAQPVNLKATNYSTIRAAVDRGFLRYHPQQCLRPTKTVLTEKGREALAIALADWADALTRARDADDSRDS